MLSLRSSGTGCSTHASRSMHARASRVLANGPCWRRAGGQPRRGLVARAEPKKVTETELNELIAKRDKPMVVDFFATWCGPCLLLAKELEKVASDLGDGVDIYKIDVDENPSISSALQIQGLPTLIFISPNQEKQALRTEGLLPASTIKQIVANEL